MVSGYPKPEHGAQLKTITTTNCWYPLKISNDMHRRTIHYVYTITTSNMSKEEGSTYYVVHGE